MKLGNKEFVKAFNETDNLVSLSLINESDWVPNYPRNKKYKTIGSLGTKQNAVFNYNLGIIRKHFPSTYYNEIRNSTLSEI